MNPTTNFITPPDFVDDEQHTILLIDVDPVDVETLAFLCGSHNESFNVYLYKEDLHNVQWLEIAAAKADTIIVNTIPNSISSIKEAYLSQDNGYYYGPKKFLNNKRELTTIFDYFVNRANELNTQSHTISSL